MPYIQYVFSRKILNMSATENLHAASADHTIAFARWDDDGGAAKNSPSAGKTVHDEPSRPTARSADRHTGRDR
jgi:hypothetical protein